MNASTYFTNDTCIEIQIYKHSNWNKDCEKLAEWIIKDLTSKFIMTTNYRKGKNLKSLLPTVQNDITFWKCQNNCAIVSWGQDSVQLSSMALFLSTNTGHLLSCQHLVITDAWETNFITYWWWKCKSANIIRILKFDKM